MIIINIDNASNAKWILNNKNNDKVVIIITIIITTIIIVIIVIIIIIINTNACFKSTYISRRRPKFFRKKLLEIRMFSYHKKRLGEISSRKMI